MMKCLVLTLMACVLLATSPQAGSVDDPDKEEADVTIALTMLDVNDTNLGLSWKIVNGSDHDIWICAPGPFDTYMAKDNQTLVIRRRFDLPISDDIIVERPWTIKGRYLRLLPGQEHTESVSLDLPIGFDRLFEVEPGNAERAGRLDLEIGFYDEDLRNLILRIVEMADKFNCTGSAPGDREIYGRYFGGLWIAGRFNSSSYQYFRDSVNSTGEEILVPPLEPVRLGEQVLQLSVDGVSIPYKSNYPPLTSQASKSTEAGRMSKSLVQR